MIHDSILGTVGNTPIVRINRLAPQGVELYAKLEYFNPMSSVKDRLALAIVLDAEKRGALRPGQTIVEATSGNTGVALAGIAAARGYPFVAFMTETFSVERRKLMRALGARVILTPAAERGSGMVKAARAFAEKHGAFLANQFGNPANPAYHASTTGPEILRDFAGRRLDWFVSGYGTGGTISGAGRVLKAARPELKIAVTEPAGAALLAGNEWKPHKIQGWTPDFLPDVLDRDIFDRNVPIDDVVARDTARALAQKEGIFCGISSGATVAAALEIAKEADPGTVILATVPDTGERYLSTFLFEGMEEGSDDAWLAELEKQSTAGLP
ncbi:cysteine synthase A [Coralloluteibacterium stylophorae]|uniref:cysteine synthase n=1 Tax=Coralloluteibacterium stylophorae TaxID=1776034 RepID=A0AAP2G2F5_9GAMM|nr:cysteine synthase A [Coralloluteibacterium stylophorae]MBS7458940.1 cysteine synthase A [Coralloluteibacterium stylophorae]